jgi:tripeptide aminopeptidase
LKKQPILEKATIPDEALQRFLRYVSFDTRSDPDSETHPSTRGQTLLAELLESELESLHGPWKTDRLADGSLLVRVPPSPGRESAIKAAFVAHLDTYYGLQGAASSRVVDCDGAAIHLGQDVSIPGMMLAPFAGKRLVVTDGSGLLGADDKAGVAALMTVLSHLAKGGEGSRHGQGYKHGPLDFWFTTDEEIGRIGIDALPPGLGESWKVLWTLDGEDLSELSVGDLAIRRARVVFHGVDAHPCLHGQDLVPAHYAASRFVDRLAALPNPMTTAGRDPFFQVASIEGRPERAEVFCRFASFEGQDLPGMEESLLRIARESALAYGARLEVELSTGSANFHEAVASHPQLIDPGRRALAARGFRVREIEIRGGTDGGLLSVTFPALPTPDLGTGARNPHSRAEFLVVDELLALPGIVLDMISEYAAAAPMGAEVKADEQE